MHVKDKEFLYLGTVSCPSHPFSGKEVNSSFCSFLVELGSRSAAAAIAMDGSPSKKKAFSTRLHL